MTAVSGLSRSPRRNACFASLPQMPASRVRTSTQSRPGSTGSGASSSLNDDHGPKYPAGETAPAILLSASFGRL